MQNDKKNFTEGPLFTRMMLFALPIILTGFLQIAYNMADNIVVGKFSGDPLALAAVGSTGTLSTLIVNLLMGIGGGGAIVVAQCFGAGDSRRVSDCVHTALTFSLVGGIAFAIFGLLITRPALELIGTKPEVLDSAELYLKIICLGIPGNAIYNFGSAILRGTGNSRAPLVILGLSGLGNVILNVFFVVVMNMTVDGVAIATITAQYISAIAVVSVLLLKKNESYALKFSKLCIKYDMLKRMLHMGLPPGVQGIVFSIANIAVTISLNTFPTAAVSANTISGNIDAITWTVINSFGLALMTFVGQNCGAKNPERVKRSVVYCLIQTVVFTVIVAAIELIFADGIIGLYLDHTNPEKDAIISYTKNIITIMLCTYPIFALPNTICAGLNGLGYSFTSMVINMICVCGVRLLWILFVLPLRHTVTVMILGYPVSWVCGAVVAVICFIRAYLGFKRQMDTEKENAEALKS